MTKPLTVEGRVNQVGFYSDCVPTLAIMFKKEQVLELGLPQTGRIEVTLVVGERKYAAGIRTTEKMVDFKLCPDLVDEGGAPIRLADVLLAIGLSQRSRFLMAIDSHSITINQG